MKKFVLATFLVASVGSVAAVADSMTGYISEAGCGAKHAAVSAANTKCVEACIKKGSDPVLVSDGKVMKFDADSKEKAKAFAGQSVKIDGTMDGDVVKITSIDKAE
jgi:lantibiotic modifying enzyme